MISIELIRNEPDRVRDAMKRRGQDAPIDRILELDAKRRSSISEADTLRAHRNEVTKRLGRMKERPQELVVEMRGVGSQIKGLEETLRTVEEEIDALLQWIPNLPDDDVPVAADETGNVVVRQVGEIPTYSFDLLPHWELGERLGIIDFQRGVKIAGSRFYVLTGKGSRLQRALIAWMMDVHTQEHGYDEVYVPYLSSSASAQASSHLPHFRDEMYHDEEDDLWLAPTAELPITNLYRDEILDPGTLPKYLVAHTPSFRREKASAGRDTRGMKRVHQFEKVEMYKFVEPDRSSDELEKLVADAEDICARLGITHRVLQLCTGDLGFAAAKSFDVELWSPFDQDWLEVSSCSNCTDFQARRAAIRYRPQPGGRARLVHTLNGSGLALPRVIIAILENYQQADGSVVIPEVLRPYTGFDLID